MNCCLMFVCREHGGREHGGREHGMPPTDVYRFTCVGVHHGTSNNGQQDMSLEIEYQESIHRVPLKPLLTLPVAPVPTSILKQLQLQPEAQVGVDMWPHRLDS